jgi:hypothetical protein
MEQLHEFNNIAENYPSEKYWSNDWVKIPSILELLVKFKAFNPKTLLTGERKYKIIHCRS